MFDALGDRMKSQYEKRTRYLLPRRTYTIIRMDGKAFHTYTRGLEKPFDAQLIEAMNHTTERLCASIQGARFGYVQSDEISLLLTDFEKVTSHAWFDGNIQKIASISASMATAYFNQKRHEQGFTDSLAFFDSRVFTVADPTEVGNYFIWRQKDAVRNSISMVAQSLYAHKELNKKDMNAMQEMIFQKGTNWNDYDAGLKRGRMAIKEYYEKEGAQRSRWKSIGAYFFTKEREKLDALIPRYE